MFNSLRKLSIKLKMTTIALIALVGFSSIIFSNYSFFDDTTSALEEFQDVDLLLFQYTNQLQVGLVDVNRLFEAAMAENDKDTWNEALALARNQGQILKKLGELKPSIESKAVALASAYDDFIEATKRYTSDVIAGVLSSEQMYLAVGPTIAKREHYEKLLREFSEEINTNLESTMSDIRGDAEVVTREQFIFGTLLVVLVLGAYVWLFIVVNRAMSDVIELSGEISNGNLNVEIGEADSLEVKKLFAALAIMRDRLKQQSREAGLRSRRQERAAKLNEALRGEQSVEQVMQSILKSLAGMLHSLVGAVYLVEGDELVMRASYAYSHRKGDRSRLKMGESLVGQAAIERNIFVISDLPDDYTPIASGLGESTPREVMVIPLVFNDHLLAVMELMSFKPFSEDNIDFVTRAAEGMAIAINSSLSRVQLAEALERSKLQAEALEQQQEELRATNEELEEQAAVLRSSEESLQQQQEELRVMNEELEERNRLLDRQKDEIEKNNQALEVSRKDLEEKARQLEMSGRYKTEFLSTMSHELRTPLNSILILSQGLMENKKSNLDSKQVEHAKVINSSGRDLLMLINDILDLSKVEEGKLEIVSEAMPLEDLASKLHGQFDAHAESKHIEFNVEIDAALPDSIVVDEHRLSQILRNFISNALKFTHQGMVEVGMRVPEKEILTLSGMLRPEEAIEFRVRDTGIGIPKDKLDLIFEAFQQVDGTISRKYGGTGLGLTISRKLADIMKGTVKVTSEGENQGSVFSLYLPRTYSGEKPVGKTLERQPIQVPVSATPEKKPDITVAVPNPQKPQPVVSNAILIVEDDAGFSSVLKNLAEEFGFQAFCAHSVKDARAFLEEQRPGSIILDLGLPDAPGEELLSQIKSNPQTKDIPVHVISGQLNVNPSSIEGAEEFIAKPFGRDRLDQLFNDISSELSTMSSNRVLVIEDDAVQQEQLQQSFAEQNVVCEMAETGQQAIDWLKRQHFGAIILDLELPDTDGFQLVETLSHCTNGNTPIIIYTARDLDKRQDAQLRKYAKRIVLKTDKSISRLLNETTLFLHWLKGVEQAAPLKEPEDTATVKLNDVEGKRLLLVDDDIRNLYSLSAVLEESGFEIETAGTGIEAIEMLDESRFDLVLMDVMMPEMDGLEAMQQIRLNPQFKSLPIIALTAKAMKDDRARCIEAGANDYLSKPVDTNKLKAIVKMWLGQA